MEARDRTRRIGRRLGLADHEVALLPARPEGVSDAHAASHVAQVAKRRLIGKEGSERVKTIGGLMDELPDYRNGPYADLRKWLLDELDRTRTRAKVVRRDSIRFVVKVPPRWRSWGRPTPASPRCFRRSPASRSRRGTTRSRRCDPCRRSPRSARVPIQLVEIPGLIDGATDDRGGGRALLGVLRGADAIVLCHALDTGLQGLETVRSELAAAGIEKPTVVAATKLDEGNPGGARALARAVAGLEVVPVSVLDDASLDALRRAIFKLKD